MSGLVDLARRHALAAFFVLAYGLSWWPWVWYRIDPAAMDAPILPFGPLIAALVMLALIGGWPEMRGFLAKIAHWRVAPGWYLFVFLVPPAVTAMAFGTNLFLGATLPAGTTFPEWGDIAVRFVFIFVTIGLGEEPAWRGYALPRLMQGRTALVAALILGGLHALWHLPLFGVEYDLANLWPWLAAVVAVSVVTAWLVVNTGSLLLPALMHAMVNTSAFVWGWLSGGDQLRLWWIWGALWVAVAAIVGLVTGPDLKIDKPRKMAR